MARDARWQGLYDQIRRLPALVNGEILAGELYVTPRPAVRHAHASSRLGALLAGPFDSPPGNGCPGGWWILDEPELHLGDDVVIPDLAGWRRERMPKLPDVAAIELPPDWVCEMASPSTMQLDRVQKKRSYARARVGHLWLIDPIARTLEAFRLEGGRWLELETLGGDARAALPPFEAITLDLVRLWLEE